MDIDYLCERETRSNPDNDVLFEWKGMMSSPVNLSDISQSHMLVCSCMWNREDRAFFKDVTHHHHHHPEGQFEKI